MTKIITLVLALTMVLLDFIAYRRLKNIGASKAIRYAFGVVILFS